MADYIYVKSTGVILPDTESVLTDVQGEYKTAFGQDLVVTPSTPQGVLITGETLARVNVIINNAVLANQINPNEAGGIFLDAIAALTGLSRPQNTFSFTTVNIHGVEGTIIPAGTLLQSTSGDLWKITQVITIPVGGDTTGPVQAVLPGPVAASPDAINTIVAGSVLGFETVTNPSAATLGSLEFSDEAFRILRNNTLALQGSSLAGAITAAVYLVPNVQSLKFRENVKNTTEIIDDVTMVPHSIYVCVSGGTDLAVATAILSKKSGGANYNRDAGIGVTVDVTEPASGQVFPVSFDRPNLIAVGARVTISSTTAVTDPAAAVRQAILDYANGLLEGELGFTVGSSVSSFELAGAVNREFPAIYVRKVEIKKIVGGTYSTDEILIAIFEKATIEESAIQVVIT